MGGRFVLTVEHSVSQHELSTQTPFGTIRLPSGKAAEKTFVYWKGENYPLRVLYKNRADDVALFLLPPDVRPPSFPFPFGDSGDLAVGNYVYVLGRPLNGAVNVREGIVSATSAPKEVSTIKAKGENAFMVTNGLMRGDSGTPVLAIRDGGYELVGLAQGTYLGGPAGGGPSASTSFGTCSSRKVCSHFRGSEMDPFLTWTWLAGALGGILLAAAGIIGILARLIYGSLVARIERHGTRIERHERHHQERNRRLESKLDNVHKDYARRDDITRELEAIRGNFVEVFTELRRANEGIAALAASVGKVDAPGD